MPCIAMIEDDAAIAKLVTYALEKSDYEAYSFADGAAYFQSGLKPDLLILDIMLPGDDGMAILHKIRKQEGNWTLPIMMLTARGAEYDKVQALEDGADDYLTKPFGVMELLARVKALLRRHQVEDKTGSVLRVGAIALDPERRRVWAGAEEIALTYKEFELLHYLMQHAGIVLSRERLMLGVWGFDFEGESRTVDMHIRLLRQKLGEAGVAIETVRGVGYRLAEEVKG